MQRRLAASAVLSASSAMAATSHAAEPPPTWVFFRDKGAALDANALDARASAMSKRTLSRRQRARGDAGVDLRDLDVSETHVGSVLATGARLRARSRWLNAISVAADPEQLRQIRGLPGVSAVKPVARGTRAPPGRELVESWRGPVVRHGDEMSPYGLALEQLALLSVPDMHDCGLSGAGVVVAVLDSGFVLTHQALMHLDVLAQRDFVKGDDDPADGPGDVAGQQDHGTSVLSLLAGHAPAGFMGVAPDITVILAKTEDITLEQPIEEDWFVAGLEWAEELGADIATASLGYIDWYSAADFDGQTAVSTIAANVAIENGVIMVASAGNWGPAPSTTGAPADAKTLIAVGAVDLGGLVTEFSSRGPTFDGRVKPDVSALGLQNWVVVPGTVDYYMQGNGTSYAAPMIAGVAALLKQAYPKLGPAEMHALLTGTASQAATPNNDIGYGVVRGYDAAGLYCTCQDVDGDDVFDIACGGTDCEDRDAEVFPEATEQCNGRDDDCDEELLDGEEDVDGDGALACDGDCDDTDETIHPDAPETCDDGLDNDCDGDVDLDDTECEPPPPEQPNAAPPADSADGGCGCQHGSSPTGWPMWLAGLAFWVVRRTKVAWRRSAAVVRALP